MALKDRFITWEEEGVWYARLSFNRARPGVGPTAQGETPQEAKNQLDAIYQSTRPKSDDPVAE